MWISSNNIFQYLENKNIIIIITLIIILIISTTELYVHSIVKIRAPPSLPWLRGYINKCITLLLKKDLNIFYLLHLISEIYLFAFIASQSQDRRLYL